MEHIILTQSDQLNRYRHLNGFVSLLLACLFLAPVLGRGQAEKDPVAENMLLYQRYNGGWAKAVHGKKITYDHHLSHQQIQQVLKQKSLTDATIDNKATTKEIHYLFAAFDKTGLRAYLTAGQKGLDYLLGAQYENGGWPQYYPDSSLYRSQVTFNDDAMVNVVQLLYSVAKGKGVFAAVDANYRAPCRQAVKRAVDCILKTQITVNGKKTAWCQQYNKTTLLPEKARSFELVGLAVSESVRIVRFLMRLDAPSAAVKSAIHGAVNWFREVAISGYAVEHVNDPTTISGKDVLLVREPQGKLWARFYEMGTNRPFFCGRDGQKKYALKAIENERRVGYAWYGTWPASLLHKDYPAWLLNQGKNSASR